MAMPTNFTRYRSTDVYIKNEASAWTSSTSGPTAPAAADFFYVAEVPVMPQAGNYTDFSETGSELINTRKVLNYVEYTAMDLVFYAKPDNAAGSAPAEDKLLTSFFGTKTVAGSTSVTYSISNTIQTHSIWTLQRGGLGNEARNMMAAAGAVPTTMGVALAKDGPVTFTMGFQAPRIYYAGTSEIATGTYNSNVLTSTLDAPLRYTGATMVAGDVVFPNLLIGYYNATSGNLINDNSGAGYAVTAATGATFTHASTDISSTVVDGVLAQPFLPAMAATVPNMADTSTAFEVLDQTDVAFYWAPQDTASGSLINSNYKVNATALSIDFDRSITTPALTEMSGSTFADANYVINEPTISGSATILCRPAEIPKLDALRSAPVWAMAIRIKNANANIDFYAPACHFEIPTISETDGVCQLEIAFTVVKGSNSVDANKFKLIYS